VLTDLVDEVAIGVSGHGLALFPRMPVQVEHCADGTLCVARRDEQDAFVDVAPGAEPARETPARVETEGGGVRFCCGARGPVLTPSLVEPLAATFAAIENGPHIGPWRIVCAGFAIAFPPGFAALAEKSDDTFFELHLLETVAQSSYVRFVPVRRGDVEIVLKTRPARQSTRTGEGQMENASGHQRWIEFAYTHLGEPWRQRRYFMPVSDQIGVLAIAQAREARADALFAGAHAVARSFTVMMPPRI
jgi:hypothetical protein